MAGICNVANVKATNFGGGELYTVINNSTDMDNGSIVLLGERVTGSNNVFNVKTPTTNTTDKGTFLLIDSPEINPKACNFQDRLLQNFTNKKGTLARAYSLSIGDVFDVSSDQITALSGTPVLNNYVILTDGQIKYKEAASINNETFACQIDFIYQLNRPVQIAQGDTNKPIQMVRLRVVKCEKQ